MSEGGFGSTEAGDLGDEPRPSQTPDPARTADGERAAEGQEPEERAHTEVVQPEVGADRHGPTAVEETPGAAAGGAEEQPDEGEGEMAAVVEPDEVLAEDASLAAVAKQRDEYLDALRRLQADFENYKKRVLKQQTQHLERAAEDLVVKLLPVLDALDLAVVHAGDSPEGKVLGPIATALVDVLAKEGLERIDPEGERFDPTQHDAVLHEEHEGDEGGEPEVTDVLRAGYRWKGRVLRPAMVKVKG